MRRVLLALLLMAPLCVGAKAQFGPGVLLPRVASSAAVAVGPPSFDTATAITATTAGSLALPAITTASTNEILILGCASVSNVTGVSDTASLSWTKRFPITTGAIDWWFAKAASVVTSDVVTATFGFGASNICAVFAIKSILFSAPFDSNASLPSYTAGVSTVYSTTNANDLVVAFVTATGSATPTNPTGFTAMTASASNVSLGYQIVSAAQSSVTVTGNNSPNKILVDALQ